MKLCFLVEEHYRHDGMPLDVVRQLTAWGHRVDVLRPGDSLMAVSEAVRAGSHDAWVLKTVSGGPGLTLLEAAAAVGLTTVNDARSIRGVRDKALASVIARTRGLPVPVTYAAARWERLAEIPAAEYPLVVKPADGSSGRAVRFVRDPGHLAELGPLLAGEGLLIAQPYVPNSGTDLKVYCVDGELYATERRSPLNPDQGVRERQVPLAAEVARIAGQVGEVFGLDLYGVDVLLGPDGPVVVDINDFPSFRQVPDAVARVARAVLRLARTGTAVTAPATLGAAGLGAPGLGSAALGAAALVPSGPHAPGLAGGPLPGEPGVTVGGAPEPVRMPVQGGGAVGAGVGAAGVGGAI
ncbi:ATP-grasp domain-containing protein [Kitasatospora sp. NBC_00458]|uniref:ATP-grasp domain-containing protein n=1 Tax=Kitasatospora sp. NBC_00458 TaxID=2903568 RepID=UPI002E18CA0C